MILFLTGILISSCKNQAGHDTALLNENVKTVLEDNQQLNSAIVKARQTFFQFDTAFKSGRYDTDEFSLKVKFETKNGYEHIWTYGIVYEDSTYYGFIDEDPISAINVKRGDRIKVTIDNLSDWIYADKGVLIGGFTIRAFRNQMSDEEKKKFDSTFKLKILD